MAKSRLFSELLFGIYRIVVVVGLKKLQSLKLPNTLLLLVSHLNYDEANNLVVELSNNCEKLALDRFLVQAKSAGENQRTEYVVYIEPFLGMVLKQEVNDLLNKYHLCLREDGNGAVIYSPQPRT